MGIDSFGDAAEFAKDAIELKDLMLLAPDFKALLDVNEYFDSKVDQFLALGEKDVLSEPKKVNVLVVEATMQLNAASGALDNITASGLRFAEYYLKDYREKLDKVIFELNRKRIKLFDEVMRFLPYDTFASRGIQRMYDVEELDGDALIELKNNLDFFKEGVFAFRDKFNGIVDPNLQMRPCSNRALSHFMIDQDHEQVFEVVYDFIVNNEVSEKSPSELYADAQELAKKLKMIEAHEAIEKENDEREAEDIYVELMENEDDQPS